MVKMKQIKIYFEDFWSDFIIHDNFIINILKKEYEVTVDKNPDYLFFSVFGYKHLGYRNCIKIFYSGENREPDFNLCDYAIAFQHLNAGDRYFRYPLYVEAEYGQINSPFDAEKALRRQFCNFVYSNSRFADPVRERFFRELSKYKRVDSGGRYLNNIGKPVVNKSEFIKNYKFTIAFENSSLSGYTTEKIVEPMLVNSLPIYWGNPDIHLDFNKDAFVYVNDFETLEAAIEEVIRLDKDDDAYIRKLSQVRMTRNGKTYEDWQNELLSFLKNIFEQKKDKAKRTTDYGAACLYRTKRETMELFTKKIICFTIGKKEFELLVRTKNNNSILFQK